LPQQRHQSKKLGAHSFFIQVTTIIRSDSNNESSADSVEYDPIDVDNDEEEEDVDVSIIAHVEYQQQEWMYRM
jgi:hypothetical protein